MSSADRAGAAARTFGKYSLIKSLGVGGMAEVWLARNRATAAEVAVKLCAGSLPDRADAAARFRQEARLGAMLAHRSIVRIFDLVEEPDGTLLLVMELLRGETLERYLRAKGSLGTREAVAIALPILSALAHAHELGVVHRDVSPANIFLAVDPDGHVTPKLVDFGIAKLPGSGLQTLEGRVLGTPRYMAPEQIRGHGDIDGRCDLFAVGVVVFEMLTGTSPFAAGSPSASLAAVLEDTVDPDPRIDPAVWIVLQRALAKRAYERHGSAREMAQALAAASGESEADLAQLPKRSPPSRESAPEEPSGALLARSVGGHSLGSTGAPFAGRRMVTPWLAAALLAASVLGGAAAAVRHNRTGPPANAMGTAASSTPRSATAATTSDAPRTPALAPPSSLSAPEVPSRPIATGEEPAPQGTPPSPNPMSSAPKANRPAHPRHPKVVATTPGF